jgi:hypothetical protein
MTALYLLFLDADEFEALRGAFKWRKWFNHRSQENLVSGPRRDPPSGFKGWHQREMSFREEEPSGQVGQAT